MFDQILILDAETRWSSKPVEWAPDAYTLSKMTTEEYIRSPLFKAFGFGCKKYGEEGAAIYLQHGFLKQFFSGIDWSRTAVCMHNSQFDCAILTWIYGIKPAFIFDTLSMARALYGIDVGNSAKKLAERFNLPPKGHATQSSDGLFELPLSVEQELADYCKHDVFLCEKFLDNMLPGFPKKELKLIDATIRMFTEPQLALDKDLLHEAITEDSSRRTSLLGRLGVVDEQLASNDKFAATLRAIGVDPPTKISPTTNKEVFAFAKNDALFQQILNGDNEDAVMLCEARMMVKSTQERTRAQRFLDIAGRADGLLPVPVNYCHTRTTRWGASRGSSLNMQNLKRGGKLRKSIIAPDGYKCVAGDLSQIEPRVLAYLSDFTELLEIFASGKDAYAQFGAGMFGIPDLTKEKFPDLRQSAKSALLGCFSSSTKVLTQRGWIPIVQVRTTDQLWDGEEWVTHLGVVAQGMKAVTHYKGVWATEDHEILVQGEWQAWQSVRTNPILFKQALSTATLPASGGNEHKTQTGHGAINQRCVARADQKNYTHEHIYCQEKQNDVTSAGLRTQNRPLDMGLQKLFHSSQDMLLGSLHALNGAIELRTMTRGCAVHAGGKDLFNGQTSVKAGLHAVTRAQLKKQKKQYEQTAPTLPYAQTTRTATGFLTESLLRLSDAQIKTAQFIQTTVAEASRYTANGLKIGQNFLGMSLRSMVGTNQNYSLTALTTVADMSRGIYDSVRAALTWLTSARSKPVMSKSLSEESNCLSKKTQTYDIAMAGPRNRYTILTDDGPILVHNCGYRLGWASFASQLLVGFLGAPPVRYDRAFMKQLGITKQAVVEFMTGYQYEGRRGAAAGTERIERMMEIPHTCTDQELLVHCVCAKEIIDRYRRASKPITDFWDFLDKMIATVIAVPDAEPVVHKCLTFMPGKIKLPNGLFMTYDKIKVETDAIGRPQYSYWNGKTYKALHSGIVAENVTSGTARCVIGDGMLRVQPRYRCAMPVHDEAVYVVPDEEVDEALVWIKQQLIAPVKYLPGIPLDATIGAAQRYGDSK